MSATKQQIKKILYKTLGFGFLGYAGTSIFLFKNPHFKGRAEFTQREIKGQKKLMICAHRLGSYDFLENTVPAAVNSVQKSGAHMLQVEIRGTKDHVPIMVHDQDLSRLCAIGRMTHEFEYKKLPPMSKNPLNIPFCMDKDTGMSKLYQRKKNDSQKVNTFEELLKGLEKVDQNRDVWLNIEYKDADLDAIGESYQLLKQYKRDQTTIWSHVDDELAEGLTAIDPKIKR